MFGKALALPASVFYHPSSLYPWDRLFWSARTPTMPSSVTWNKNINKEPEELNCVFSFPCPIQGHLNAPFVWLLEYPGLSNHSWNKPWVRQVPPGSFVSAGAVRWISRLRLSLWKMRKFWKKVCFGVCGESMCVDCVGVSAPVWSYKSQSGVLGMFLYCYPPPWLETRSFTEPETCYFG